MLTGADTTLAGLDDEPAEVSGYGRISAHTFRELAARSQTVHALTTDPATETVTTVTTVTTTWMVGGGDDVRGGSVETRARQLA